MKKKYKIIFINFFLFFIVTSFVSGQTNISGGIYSNTTWTLLNSPYIVVDTVVVYPGVTLTIEPGVVVKFDSTKYLEIRQANLIAVGTVTDSITFTSNSATPVPSSWSMVDLNNNSAHTISRIKYCNFKYAGVGILCSNGITDNLSISNSNFNYNFYGISIYGGRGINTIDSSGFNNNLSDGIDALWFATMNNCIVSNNRIGIESSLNCTLNNCTIDSNQLDGIYGPDEVKLYGCKIEYNEFGLSGSFDSRFYNCIIKSNFEGVELGFSDSLINCDIQFNNIAVYSQGDNTIGGHNVIKGCTIENNLIGIEATTIYNEINCNKICNNSTYDLEYTAPFGNNLTVANNYWCTSDSVIIKGHIFDGLDTSSYGIVSTFPIDTSLCYLTAFIPQIAYENLLFTIYPNPCSNSTTIEIYNTQWTHGDLVIYDAFGQVVYQQSINSKQEILNLNLPNSIYFYRISNEKKEMVGIGKLIIQ